MTNKKAHGLCLESGEFVPAAELNAPVAPSVPTCATGGDWKQPTTVTQRLGDVLQLLCGGKRPSDDAIEAWMGEGGGDLELQNFCATHGPAWAQGIALIDLAMVAVEQPTEGVEHEFSSEEQQEVHGELYCRLHGLSKSLESGGRIDEHEHPDAYQTILDAMRMAAEKGGI